RQPLSSSASALAASYTGSGMRKQEHGMRTGAEYRQALRDGRRVWVMGEGLVEDVTTHPATRAMVDEYVAWYDLHLDPVWHEVAIRPPDAESEPTLWAYVVP